MGLIDPGTVNSRPATPSQYATRECRTPGIMEALSLVLQVRTCDLMPLQE